MEKHILKISSKLVFYTKEEGTGGKPQFWWENEENVCLFGNPDLLTYVPDNTYRDVNHWDKSESLCYNDELFLNGHMPFCVKSYPNEKTPFVFWQQYLWLIAALIVVVIVVVCMVYLYQKGKK